MVAEDNRPPTQTVQETGIPTHAQPKLPTLKLWIGAEELIAEVARSPREQQTGMMFRKSMEENEAMIFVLPVAREAAFWMKNTEVPLSLAYVDNEGKILEIYDLEPHNEESVPSKSDQVRFVIEVKQGWFKRHGIQPGTVAATEYGSLFDTFFVKRLP